MSDTTNGATTTEEKAKLESILHREFIERIFRIKRELSDLQDWDIRVGYSDLNRAIDSPASKFHFLRLNVEDKLNKILGEVKY